MSEHEPREPEAEERERPDDAGNPWAKTSSGDADEIVEDENEDEHED